MIGVSLSPVWLGCLAFSTWPLRTLRLFLARYNGSNHSPFSAPMLVRPLIRVRDGLGLIHQNTLSLLVPVTSQLAAKRARREPSFLRYIYCLPLKFVRPLTRVCDGLGLIHQHPFLFIGFCGQSIMTGEESSSYLKQIFNVSSYQVKTWSISTSLSFWRVTFLHFSVERLSGLLQIWHQPFSLFDSRLAAERATRASPVGCEEGATEPLRRLRREKAVFCDILPPMETR